MSNNEEPAAVAAFQHEDDVVPYDEAFTMAIVDTLPDKLSDLIDVAVADARKSQEAMRFGARYQWNMAEWHQPHSDGMCSICWSGSILMNTLGVPITVAVHGSVCCPSLRRKLYAIDMVRHGWTRKALREMGQPDHPDFLVADDWDESEKLRELFDQRAPYGKMDQWTEDSLDLMLTAASQLAVKLREHGL